MVRWAFPFRLAGATKKSGIFIAFQPEVIDFDFKLPPDGDFVDV